MPGWSQADRPPGKRLSCLWGARLPPYVAWPAAIPQLRIAGVPSVPAVPGAGQARSSLVQTLGLYLSICKVGVPLESFVRSFIPRTLLGFRSWTRRWQKEGGQHSRGSGHNGYPDLEENPFPTLEEFISQAGGEAEMGVCGSTALKALGRVRSAGRAPAAEGGGTAVGALGINRSSPAGRHPG